MRTSNLDYQHVVSLNVNYLRLQPHISSEHCAGDTFTLVPEIQSLSMQGKYMVSFDVDSLFTNIPLEESIDLAVEYIL